MNGLEESAYFSPVAELTKLIQPVGTQSFESQFDRICRSIFQNDQCNVFYFPNDGDQAPRCMLSSAIDDKLRSLTADLSREYVGGGFRSDPFLARARRRGPSARGPRVGLLNDHEVSDSGYRSQFYDGALVKQKIATLTETAGVVIYLNFYRSPQQPDFTANDCERLRSFGDMLGALAQKHLQLTGQIANAAPAAQSPLSRPDRERLRARLALAFADDAAGLTQREAEICAAICIGMNSEAIGLSFGISGNTVATHRKRAYAKLGVCSQAELFACYLDRISENMRHAGEA